MHVRTPNLPACTTSKHGVVGFSGALAAELGKDGVRVNAVGPRLINTPLNEQVRKNNPELVKIFLDHTPLGRTENPASSARQSFWLRSFVLCHRRDRHGGWRISGDLIRAIAGDGLDLGH
jgi:NAD(P)-dependent dehydrogenase (short-subunit alcohol dehydrogenase family)